MRPLRLLLSMLLAISAAPLALAAPVDDAKPGAATVQADGNAAVEADLARRLKALADDSVLLQPDRVAAILGIALKRTVGPETIAQPAQCDLPWRPRSQVDTSYAPPAQWWYRPRPQAPGKLVFPAEGINPADVTGDPAFGYSELRTQHCDDPDGTRSVHAAGLWLNGMPAFACMTKSRLNQLIPGMHVEMGTEGFSELVYLSPPGIDSGARMSFLFRAGSACTLGVQITENATFGLRHQRAHAAHVACRAAADKAFCAAHGPLAPTDRAGHDALYANRETVCGDERARYLAEPFTSEPGERVIERYGPPCDASDGR